MNRRQEECIQEFGGKTYRKEANCKTLAIWEDNINVHLQAIGAWTGSGQGQVAGVCECGNEPSGFRKMRGISVVAAELSASQKGLCSMELVFQFGILRVSVKPVTVSCTRTMRRDSSVSIVTSIWAGRPGFHSRHQQQQGVFLFPKSSRPTLGPTQPPIQWVLDFFPGSKAAGT
jgi:hypothetical protein